MARERMRPVELVEGDGDPVAPAHAPGPDPRRPGDRRRRRRLVVAAATVVVLAAGAGTAQAVQDARERARFAAVAGQWGVVAPVQGPLEALWTTDADTLSSSVMTASGILVGVEPRSEGVLEVTAIDARTGEERWRTPLLELPDHPDPDVRGRLGPAEGQCVPDGRLVVCLATDTREDLLISDPMDAVDPTTARVLLLDARDGHVVRDLTEVAGTPLPSMVALVDDLVVTAGADDEVAYVRGLTTGGEHAWERTMEAPRGPRRAAVRALGEHLVAATSKEVVLLGTDGTEHARMPVGDRGWIALTAATTAALVRTRVEVVDREDMWDATTTVLREGDPLELDGMAVQALVDDGSVPGLTMTMTRDATLHAWDAEGAVLWSADVRTSSMMVLDGRVHLVVEGGPGRPAGSSLVTVDARTGEELWSGPGGGGTASDGRLLYRADDSPSGRDLVAVDPASGEEVWREPLPGCRYGLSPVAGLLTCALDDDDRATVIG